MWTKVRCKIKLKMVVCIIALMKLGSQRLMLLNKKNNNKS